MKIDNKNVLNTINNLVNQNTIKCLLLYGESLSTIENRYKTVIDIFKKDSYDIVSINPDLLKTNETLLCDEFLSISMFATKTLYTLKLVEKENSFTKNLEFLFDNNNLNENPNFLVITAGNLDVTSSLRKYTEKSKNIACIACYEENSKDIMTFIVKKLKELNFVFNSEVTEYLYNNIGNNSLMAENEIKKIDLYKGENRHLTIEDVEKIVIDISNTNINDFCNNFCNLNLNETLRNLRKIYNEGVETIVLIRSLSRYFMQLQKIKYLINECNEINEVFKTEKIFWKQQILLSNHIKKWNISEINTMIKKLAEVERDLKFSINARLIFENFVLRYLIKKNKINND